MLREWWFSGLVLVFFLVDNTKLHTNIVDFLIILAFITVSFILGVVTGATAHAQSK